MNIITSDDCIGILSDHELSKSYTVYGYPDGAFSLIPHHFFRTWTDDEPPLGTFHLGRCSGLGVGSIAKYDGYARLIVGKHVSGGSRLRFILTCWHEMRSITTSMLGAMGNGLLMHPMSQPYGDTVLKHDIWIGDEAMFLGGSVIESGCVIGARTLVPANSKTEPYGVYAGSPARLIRFRFPEKVREKLLELAWWDMPFSWIKENNAAFLVDLAADEGRALELLAELKLKKDKSTAVSSDTPHL
ncbi:acetyltransferase [Burkholderia ubonensis]|uniref:acetyltransferase n=1 Tax=Burkholderia ubonensis TaxID=101571 RepID=UPI00076C7685|nr:acetyltransferase [Burkholderia ubonensis]KWN63577.1 acetyltransferase [Burkholderia ubonensis]